MNVQSIVRVGFVFCSALVCFGFVGCVAEESEPEFAQDEDDSDAIEDGQEPDTTQEANLEIGTLKVCIESSAEHLFQHRNDEQRLEFSGQVVAIDTTVGVCTRSITLEDELGNSVTVGLLAKNAVGTDVSPTFDTVIGDQIELLHIQPVVFGSVSGFVLRDTEGLVLVADEGTFGSAFKEADVPEFTVAMGDESLGLKERGCQPMDLRTIHFATQSSLELAAVDSGLLTVENVDYTALALASFTWGQSTKCTISDVSDVVAWVVYR